MTRRDATRRGATRSRDVNNGVLRRLCTCPLRVGARIRRAPLPPPPSLLRAPRASYLAHDRAVISTVVFSRSVAASSSDRRRYFGFIAATESRTFVRHAREYLASALIPTVFPKMAVTDPPNSFPRCLIIATLSEARSRPSSRRE